LTLENESPGGRRQSIPPSDRPLQKKKKKKRGRTGGSITPALPLGFTSVKLDTGRIKA